MALRATDELKIVMAACKELSDKVDILQIIPF